MMPSIHQYLLGIKPKDGSDKSQKHMFPSVCSPDLLYLWEPVEGWFGNISPAQLQGFRNARSGYRICSLAESQKNCKFTSLFFSTSNFDIKGHEISGNETWKGPQVSLMAVAHTSNFSRSIRPSFLEGRNEGLSLPKYNIRGGGRGALANVLRNAAIGGGRIKNYCPDPSSSP
ncbi:hypothetical protein DM860_016608 [Cuscuta australis]|uniref:Uncharacterized protein n=1 Tax=Cuscuta australis TaxID=267555 RepID=A0A328DKA1_9ASTE|nr:hypothetical protein DM860_016608 [Cuscuta australis]